MNELNTSARRFLLFGLASTMLPGAFGVHALKPEPGEGLIQESGPRLEISSACAAGSKEEFNISSGPCCNSWQMTGAAPVIIKTEALST